VKPNAILSIKLIFGFLYLSKIPFLKMSITTENIQTTVGNLNADFAGRQGDHDFDNTKRVHIHRRNRAYVWNKDMQLLLIDSILKGYYIPPIICCSRPVDGRERREVMEGGNRITTFRRILRGDVRELTIEERIRIESYPLTLVLMSNMDIKAQRNMFRRLNNNIKVSNGQLYAMSEDDSPLIKEAIAFLDEDEYPLRNLITEHFFETRGADNNVKKNLENAVALISGSLYGPHFITKLYNIQEIKIEDQTPIQREVIIGRLQQVFKVFTIANTIVPLTDRRKTKPQFTIGNWLGAILYDILTNPDTIEEKQNMWANYIAAVRRGDENAKDASKLTNGAQNLKATRYRRICMKVSIFMNEKRLALDEEIVGYTHIDEDDEDEEDETEDEEEDEN
jgi:hypothetical protein